MNTINSFQYDLNSFEFLILGFLVIFMVVGLTMFEAGMIRTKNIISNLINNISGIGVGCLLYLFIGHRLIYGDYHVVDPILQQLGLLATNLQLSPITKQFYHPMSFTFYHLFIPGIIVSIMAGAMAERVKAWPFLFYAIVVCGFIFPALAHWLWGKGFLYKIGFIDEAGAGVIYLCGAVAGFAGTLLLGPRQGKYNGNGRWLPMRGANLPLATIGVLCIWIGSLGFNSGTHFDGQKLADVTTLSQIFVNTSAAVAASLIASMLVTRIFYGSTDLTLILNSVLAGLVSIAAAPATPDIYTAMIIGALTGIISMIAINVLDHLRIDDPVGSISVFGVASVCSLFATLFVNHNQNTMLHQLWIQFIGITTIIIWVFVTSTITLLMIKYLIGFRIDPEVERRGLDVIDCNMTSYPEFTAIGI